MSRERWMERKEKRVKRRKTTQSIRGCSECRKRETEKHTTPHTKHDGRRNAGEGNRGGDSTMKRGARRRRGCVWRGSARGAGWAGAAGACCAAWAAGVFAAAAAGGQEAGGHDEARDARGEPRPGARQCGSTTRGRGRGPGCTGRRRGGAAGGRTRPTPRRR